MLRFSVSLANIFYYKTTQQLGGNTAILTKACHEGSPLISLQGFWGLVAEQPLNLSPHASLYPRALHSKPQCFLNQSLASLPNKHTIPV